MDYKVETMATTSLLCQVLQNNTLVSELTRDQLEAHSPELLLVVFPAQLKSEERLPLSPAIQTLLTTTTKSSYSPFVAFLL